jgi:hypothetical protein
MATLITPRFSRRSDSYLDQHDQYAARVTYVRNLDRVSCDMTKTIELPLISDINNDTDNNQE